MTPEEIKKIAEAYAEAKCPAGDYCGGVYDELRNCDLSICYDDAKLVLEWLTERYYLVEKGKVAQEYDNCIYLSVNYPEPSERRIAKSVTDELKSLFGSDIRKEEEE